MSPDSFSIVGKASGINESSDTVGRVAMLLWCIWHNRNDKLWNDNVQMSRQIGRHAFDAWNDWYSVHKLQSNIVSGTTEADLVRWEKPALDWVKCNVDVAFVSGSGRTSVGLCFRDNSGHFIAEADLVRWEKPALDWVKCNVDVAFVSGSGRTSVGLCFRDNSGHFIAGMTQ
ncbi:hypothetical protein TSUD_317870 [Trifolium subterraneum]|uniref:RNase H type-1 domain-containing protein n=1 Tax=Trifolium subterraneum TaxID=3900 RepID=A0A2Z6NNC6_TRISU|nr:hypothetical protein TSUD_317870 [Trifolium subterraneum]